MLSSIDFILLEYRELIGVPTATLELVQTTIGGGVVSSCIGAGGTYGLFQAGMDWLAGAAKVLDAVGVEATDVVVEDGVNDLALGLNLKAGAFGLRVDLGFVIVVLEEGAISASLLAVVRGGVASVFFSGRLAAESFVACKSVGVSV